jgi:protein O-GlcNAc transferase
MSRSNKVKSKARSKAPVPVLDAESAALMRLVQAQRVMDAEHAARKILSGQPAHYFALKALSFALISQGRMEEALPILEFAVPRFDRDPELHNNLGIVLSYLMRWDEALACFRYSLELQPKEPEVLKNLGVALVRMHRWDDALPVLLQAMEHHPGDYLEAIQVLADALACANRVDEAATCFRELWQADPGNTDALYQLLSASLRSCEWQDFRERMGELRSRDPSQTRVVGPLAALSFPKTTAVEHLAYARACARSSFPWTVLARAKSDVVGTTGPSSMRRRVGFMSADFRQHAVGLLLPHLLELLDRECFEVFGYSIGPDDGSDIHQRIVGAFDHFEDLLPLSHRRSARRIREDELDILIDLQGWTEAQRAEVLALRCAPIQVSWLGYPGTMGHTCLADYLLGDATVTPLDHADFYTETIAQLPYCYLPADATRGLDSPPSRTEAGLPEKGFVFCSLNSSYKLNPDSFDVWCRILRECPDSILWLSTPSPTAKNNLQHEAASRGIDSSRLIFAPRTETQAQHLARLQLADLALDTFPYNSHSTGIDTLWAGVPMVTCMGQTFASRVGASTLRAAHLGELVTTDFDQYQALAIDLYRDGDRLAQLRRRLAIDKTSLPLFDMAGFARDMGDVLQRMWQAHLDGRRDPISSRNCDPSLR